MCGFAGHAGGRAVAALGAGVMDALRHRGPDAQRTERCATGDVTADLAFARLAIVDLSTPASSR
jgi:asparagine synthetase B (glutamine-hydrolysing)